MIQQITCISESALYALTRGQAYELLAQNEEKGLVRVRGDMGRARWFPAHLFDFTNSPVVTLVSWRFDEPVTPVVDESDDLNAVFNRPPLNETFNWVDVVLSLSDGSLRWCGVATPDYLKYLLESRVKSHPYDRDYEPGITAQYLIIMRDLATETVDVLLHHLDRQGQLFECTRPVGNDPDDEDALDKSTSI